MKQLHFGNYTFIKAINKGMDWDSVVKKQKGRTYNFGGKKCQSKTKPNQTPSRE